jgi:hypothetical protein
MNDRRILPGWKDISAYVSRGVRTVQVVEWLIQKPGQPIPIDRGEE